VFLCCCDETWQLWLLLHCCFLHNPVLEEIMQSRFATKAPTTVVFFPCFLRPCALEIWSAQGAGADDDDAGSFGCSQTQVKNL
jgi:hypothetical protein